MPSEEEMPPSSDETDGEAQPEGTVSLPSQTQRRFEESQRRRRDERSEEQRIRDEMVRDVLKPIAKKVVPLRPEQEPPPPPAEIPHFLGKKEQPVVAPSSRKGPNPVQRAIRGVLRFFGVKNV